MTELASDRVTVRVGEREFFTTRATLGPSTFFTTLWALHPPEQTEYFVDGDPVLFEHVLRYLRTRIFPLFFDPVKGHDTCLYFALLQQAKFYQIEALESWLARERYKDAVETKSRVVCKLMYGERQISNAIESTFGSGERIQILAYRESVEKNWPCPEKIWQHDGHRDACFEAMCQGRLFPAKPVDMRVLWATMMVTSTEFCEEVCLPVGPSSDEPPPYVPA